MEKEYYGDAEKIDDDIEKELTKEQLDLIEIEKEQSTEVRNSQVEFTRVNHSERAEKFKRASDGRIGITQEEHSKYKELEELGTQVKELIAQKKANSERFKAAQDAFFRYEEASDKKLAELEAKIDAMLGKDTSEKTNSANDDNDQR